MYRDFLAHLSGLKEGVVVPGLERMLKACELLGNPERQFKSIHIAGTNGKGSTAAFLEAIIRKSGYRTGLFTSPHLIDVRERIQINRELMPEDDAGRIYKQVMDACGDIRLTYFELLTVIAFVYFAENKVDFAVLETGMGGRLDATNVVRPILSIITPISIDHTNFLGSDIASIAREKCGIIKEGVPVVSSEQEIDVVEVITSTLQAISRRHCETENRGNPVYVTWSRLDCFASLAVPGYQVQNASLALCAARKMKELGYKIDADCSLADVVWPGRLQKISDDPEIIVDGAHNVAGCRALVRYLEEAYPDRKKVFIFGAMKDKDIKGMVEILSQTADRWVAFDIGTERSSALSELMKVIEESIGVGDMALECCKVVLADNEDDAICAALRFNLKNPLIVVTGSLYLAGRYLRWHQKRKSSTS